MKEDNGARREPDADLVEIGFVLLLLQSGFGFISALGLLAYASISGGAMRSILSLSIAFGAPAVLLVLAAGVEHGRRWAGVATLLFEAVVLLGALLRILTGQGHTLTLVDLITTVAIPLTVGGLILVARRHAGRRRKTARVDAAPATSLDTAA